MKNKIATPVYINMIYTTVTLNLKPWKGRISHVVYVIDTQKDIKHEVEDKIREMKNSGKYKKRKIISYTISLNTKEVL